MRCRLTQKPPEIVYISGGSICFGLQVTATAADNQSDRESLRSASVISGKTPAKSMGLRIT